MGHSIEARVPLLDHVLVEFAATIPPDLKLRGETTKYIFKQAMRGILPDAVIDRPKQGFAVPLGPVVPRTTRPLRPRPAALRGAASGAASSTARTSSSSWRSSSRGRPLDFQLWTLISFEMWCRTFLDGATAASRACGATPDAGAHRSRRKCCRAHPDARRGRRAGDAVAGTRLRHRCVAAPPDQLLHVPAAGGRSASYVDPAFGTTVTRISDALTHANAGPRRHAWPSSTTSTATMTPFNQRQLAAPAAAPELFRALRRAGPVPPRSAVRDHRGQRAALVAARRRTCSITSRSISSSSSTPRPGIASPVHTFAEYAVINGRGESDICFDGDHLVLVGNHQDVFVYDISTDTKGPVLATAATGRLRQRLHHAGRSRARELVRERRRPLPRRRALRLGHGVSPRRSARSSATWT